MGSIVEAIKGAQVICKFCSIGMPACSGHDVSLAQENGSNALKSCCCSSRSMQLAGQVQSLPGFCKSPASLPQSWSACLLSRLTVRSRYVRGNVIVQKLSLSSKYLCKSHWKIVITLTATTRNQCIVCLHSCESPDISVLVTQIASTQQKTQASVTLLPGARAFQTHYRLRTHSRRLPTPAVSIVRDVAYTNRKRTLMDIYIPAQDHQVPHGTSHRASDHAEGSIDGSLQSAEQKSRQKSKQLPVALFCHGGVWATGERLLYLSTLQISWVCT